MERKIFAVGLTFLFLFLSISGCSGEKEDLRGQIESLEKQITTKEQEIASKDIEIANKDAEIEALKKEKEQEKQDCKDEVRALTEENNKLKADAFVAKVELSTIPDSEEIVCEGDNMLWTLVFSEVNGVGVSINKLDTTYYSSDGGKAGEAHRDSSNCDWLPLYIPPNGEFSIGSGSPCNRKVVKFVYYIEGIDDNGHPITTSAEFFLH
jgi:hypothetical protein